MRVFSRFNNNTRNSFYNILDSIFLPFAAVFATPIFINHLGIGDYGLWMLINSIIASISIFNLGNASTVIKYVSQFRNENEITKINQVLSTSIIFQFGISLVLVTSVVVFSQLNQALKFIPVDEEKLMLVNQILYIGAGILALRSFEHIFIGYLRGYERFDIAAWLSIGSKSVFLLAQIFAATTGGNLLTIFEFGFFALILSLSAQAVLIKLQFDTSTYFSNFSSKMLSKTIGFSGWSWILTVSMILATQIDKWLISLLAGIEKLGFYSIGFLVFSQIHMILTASLAWIFPKVSKEGINQETKKLFYDGNALSTVVSTVFSVMLVLSEFLFKYWLGDETFRSSISYIQLLLIFLPIYSLSIVPFFFLNAQELVRYNSIGIILTSIIRFVLMYIMYPYFDIEGVIIAFGLGSLFSSVFSFWIIKNKLGFNELNYIKLIGPASIFTLLMLSIFHTNVTNPIYISLSSCVIMFLYYRYCRAGFNLEVLKSK